LQVQFLHTAHLFKLDNLHLTRFYFVKTYFAASNIDKHDKEKTLGAGLFMTAGLGLIVCSENVKCLLKKR
jgi:hypothetical protein